MKLVKLYRETPAYPDGPLTAEVHPDHVSGRVRCGWRVAPEKEKAKSTAKNSKKPEPESEEDLV